MSDINENLKKDIENYEELLDNRIAFCEYFDNLIEKLINSSNSLEKSEVEASLADMQRIASHSFVYSFALKKSEGSIKSQFFNLPNEIQKSLKQKEKRIWLKNREAIKERYKKLIILESQNKEKNQNNNLILISKMIPYLDEYTLSKEELDSIRHEIEIEISKEGTIDQKKPLPNTDNKKGQNVDQTLKDNTTEKFDDFKNLLANIKSNLINHIETIKKMHSTFCNINNQNSVTYTNQKQELEKLQEKSENEKYVLNELYLQYQKSNNETLSLLSNEQKQVIETLNREISLLFFKEDDFKNMYKDIAMKKNALISQAAPNEVDYINSTSEYIINEIKPFININVDSKKIEQEIDNQIANSRTSGQPGDDTNPQPVDTPMDDEYIENPDLSTTIKETNKGLEHNFELNDQFPVDENTTIETYKSYYEQIIAAINQQKDVIKDCIDSEDSLYLAVVPDYQKLSELEKKAIVAEDKIFNLKRSLDNIELGCIKKFKTILSEEDSLKNLKIKNISYQGELESYVVFHQKQIEQLYIDLYEIDLQLAKPDLTPERITELKEQSKKIFEYINFEQSMISRRLAIYKEENENFDIIAFINSHPYKAIYHKKKTVVDNLPIPNPQVDPPNDPLIKQPRLNPPGEGDSDDKDKDDQNKDDQNKDGKGPKTPEPKTAIVIGQELNFGEKTQKVDRLKSLIQNEPIFMLEKIRGVLKIKYTQTLIKFLEMQKIELKFLADYEEREKKKISEENFDIDDETADKLEIHINDSTIDSDYSMSQDAEEDINSKGPEDEPKYELNQNSYKFLSNLKNLEAQFIDKEDGEILATYDVLNNQINKRSKKSR